MLNTFIKNCLNWAQKKARKLICTRCSFESKHKIIFELHLLFARHNYLIWKNKNC